MTRPAEDIRLVARLAGLGLNISQISRQVGVSRSTVRDWLARGGEELAVARERVRPSCTETACSYVPPRAEEWYAYLLGQYLGDGCISLHPRDVYRLRITCCDRYPEIMDECACAMRAVLPRTIGRVQREGCSEVCSYSKHWPCLFPQHGPGRKHERTIALVAWQRDIVERHPKPLLRGLLHSDGCRVLNWVNGTPYPRYHFTNRSDDIKAIFTEACDRLGIACRPSNAMSLSVARRASVALLDEFVGPKR